jgi:ABC-type multidrug transport system fused ATPase/permease subunit
VKFWRLQKRSLALLEPRSRRKFILAVILQASLGLIDVIGVLLTGVIGTLASLTYTRTKAPKQIDIVLKFLHLSEKNPANSIMILSFFALAFFLSKTALALFFTRRTFNFLATQQSRVSSSLAKQIMHSDYIWLRNQEPHVLSTTMILGISAATVNALGQILILTAEFALVAFFVLLLLIVNPLIATFTILYMCVVLYALNSIVGKRVTFFNQNQGRLRLEGETNFYNALKLFREIRVLRRMEWFQSKFDFIFSRQAHFYSEDIWIQQIPKYALEIALLVGASGLLVAGRFSTNSRQIIPILVIYLASSARIFPSLTRIQSSIFSLRSHAFYAWKALDLIEDFSIVEGERRDSEPTNDVQAGQIISDEPPSINLRKLSFRYPDSETNVISDLSLSIQPGERVAIVGSSGAGKSTLCDLLLGLLEPTEGILEIGQLNASTWINRNVGRIAYLPQDVTLIGGTLLENICLGVEEKDINPIEVSNVISRSQLGEFVKSLPDGVNANLGVNGIKISGGQKQRIGIARALYSQPKILIMDEATSALDAETEHGIMKVLENLGGDVTLIFIAHRLSSIRDFPRILYFENGELLADGNFLTVRTKVPRFNLQAELFGL